ncbi:MAG: peptidyl-prolyl cis-trans isomerase [Oscillospiraceae bacterium]|nr:peptidyl-prolyl cis-trans isomerase [Oscillospiraceae bacterium]
MKKIISALLAVAMILSMLTACGQTQESGAAAGDGSGIFYEITGIPAEKTVMTVSGIPVTAEEYLYWVAYLGASIQYNIINYNAYYGMYDSLVNDDGTMNWDEEFQDGLSLAEYVRKETESTIAFYTAIKLMAEKHNAGLDDADNKAIAESLSAAISELGGQQQFEDYLTKLGICQNTFQDMSASSYLFDNLLLQVLDENSELYLQEDKYNNYATYADHILFMTIDADSGKPLSADLMAQQKTLAEQTLAAIRSSSDPIATFVELADKYSEDTGRASNPNGYIFTPGTMVQSFEDAAKALEPGQISDIVESDYGYHIILRKDLLEALDEDPEQKVDLAQKHLTTVLSILASEATVEVMDDVKNLDVGDFYIKYNEKVQQITIEQATAAGELARAEAGITEPAA